MDLKQAKQLIAYAQRRGIKSLKIGDLEVHFGEAVIFPKRRVRTNPNQPAVASIPAPPPEPTLDQINEYIYGDTDLSA